MVYSLNDQYNKKLNLKQQLRHLTHPIPVAAINNIETAATVNFVFDNENFSVCFFQLLVVLRAITLLSILSMDSSEI